MTEISNAPRKTAILAHFEKYAASRSELRKRAAFFHSEDEAYLRFLIPPGARVLDIGCGIGDTLAALQPSLGVGVDFSPAMIDVARKNHPNLEFHVGDAEDSATIAEIGKTFDFILVHDTIGSLDDCQKFFAQLHPLCTRSTRLVVGYFSHLWQPILKLAELLNRRVPHPWPNVLAAADVTALARLAEFDPVKSEQRVLIPVSIFGLGRVVNRFISVLPGFRFFALRHYTVCRSLLLANEVLQSATVVIPARNECGNIEPAIERIPQFCDDIEIIFVEGHSKDGTFEEIERVRTAYPHKDIKAMRQPGKGKADAVFTAYDVARGDVLMILDADLILEQ
jgi:SAM-dependent methyltransferase